MNVVLSGVLEGVQKLGVTTHTINGELFLQLFHGTSKANYKKILKSCSFKPNTYFSHSHDVSKRYAQMTGNSCIVDMVLIAADSLVFDGHYFSTHKETIYETGVYK